MITTEVRVLSIQSHVVSGYVGNKSAVFPLQVLGFEVDYINSVQFSNHTGYKHVKGQVLNAKELEELVEGLTLNDIHCYTHLLTGYIGSISFLEAVKNVVKRLKSINPNLIYVCDPVMGDNGQLYVPEGLLPVYQKEIIPLADIVTPNQFEAELLSGSTITSHKDVLKVMDWFHSAGVKTVVLSSTDLGTQHELIAMASSVLESKIRLDIRIPRFPSNFTGTGDLFAALLMAWMHLTNNDLKKSMENTVASMQKVLHRTLSHASKVSVEGTHSRRDLELKLVQSLDDIRNPDVTIKAIEITE